MRSDILSDATLMRMIRLYLYLYQLDEEWSEVKMTSEELAGVMETTPATIRKDLNRLGCHADGWGYRANRLAAGLRKALRLSRPVRAGVAGLEPWGRILLGERELFPGMEICAGFDSSMNRLERTSSPVPLYPAYEIPDVFSREKLLLGIIATGGEGAQQTTDRMIAGGAAAVLNLTSRPVRVPQGRFVYQADFQSGILKLLSLINRSSS